MSKRARRLLKTTPLVPAQSTRFLATNPLHTNILSATIPWKLLDKTCSFVTDKDFFTHFSSRDGRGWGCRGQMPLNLQFSATSHSSTGVAK